jgi:hypothetical protein
MIGNSDKQHELGVLRLLTLREEITILKRTLKKQHANVWARW